MYTYQAFVTSVYDGDTITVEVDLGFTIKVTKKIRLSRINTPELRGDDREEGLKSRDRLRELILDKTIILNTIKDKTGKYGRYIGEIIVDDKNINDLLVEEGLAEYKNY